MTITYRIEGGRRPATAHEWLVVPGDGTFTMWRSMSTLSTPPSPVGRFGGPLPADVADQLDAAASKAGDAGDLQDAAPPGAAIQTVDLAHARAVLGSNADPAGPWGTLLALLREQLGALTARPVAAVGLAVADDGETAHLSHLGHEPLTLDLARAEVRAVLWRDGTKVGDWRTDQVAAGEAGTVTAKQGWSLELRLDHRLQRRPGDKLDVYVSLGVLEDGRAIPGYLLHRLG